MNELIEWGGVLLIIFLVFAETGLLLGLVLPGGETLIFTAGIFAGSGLLTIDVFLLLMLLIIAGFTGDLLGYSLGRRLGPRFYQKEDTWYFKKKYLEGARLYFQKHKRSSILLGKFLPVIRPFVPLLSGISSLKKSFFLFLSTLSVSLYIGTFLLLGYFLGNRFPQLKDYIGWILPISIIVLVVPVWIKIRRSQKEVRSA